MTHADWVSVYLQVCFWLATFGIVLRIVLLGWCDYPRKVTTSRGEDAIRIAIAVPMVIFVWWLVWGH